MKILYKLYHDFPIELGDIQPAAKTFKNRRLSSINWCLYHPSLEELVKAHNDAIEKMQELEGEIRDFQTKIFKPS